MANFEDPNKNHMIRIGEGPYEKGGAKMEGGEGKGGRGETGEGDKNDFRNMTTEANLSGDRMAERHAINAAKEAERQKKVAENGGQTNNEASKQAVGEQSEKTSRSVEKEKEE